MNDTHAKLLDGWRRRTRSCCFRRAGREIPKTAALRSAPRLDRRADTFGMPMPAVPRGGATAQAAATGAPAKPRPPAPRQQRPVVVVVWHPVPRDTGAISTGRNVSRPLAGALGRVGCVERANGAVTHDRDAPTQAGA